MPLNWGFWKRSPTWDEIAGSSALVVLCSQRDDGLWCLPTSQLDLSLHAGMSGSVESDLRREDPFGSGSLTESWHAVTSLQPLFGRRPDEITQSVIGALRGFRSNTGAYGRSIPGLRPTVRINESARHSAVALLFYLTFGDVTADKADYSLLLETARWLTTAALPEGGWSYEQSRDAAADAMSTTASIAALSRFRQAFGAKLGDDFRTLLDHSIQAAWPRLHSLREGKLWPGVHAQTEVVDTAFCLEMLFAALQQDGLNAIVGGAFDDVVAWARELASIKLERGWPARADSQIHSVAATVSVVTLLNRLSLLDAADRQRIDAVLLESLSDKSVWKQMQAWDWGSLCAFLGDRHSTLDEPDRRSLLETANALRHKSPGEPLTWNDVRGVFEPMRPAILYSLSRGQLASVPQNKLVAMVRGWPPWVRYLTPVILGALIGAIIKTMLESLMA